MFYNSEFKGYKIYVSQKAFPSLPSLLDNITRIIRPVFGAVRSLVIPYSKVKIKVNLQCNLVFSKIVDIIFEMFDIIFKFC